MNKKNDDWPDEVNIDPKAYESISEWSTLHTEEPEALRQSLDRLQELSQQKRTYLHNRLTQLDAEEDDLLALMNELLGVWGNIQTRRRDTELTLKRVRKLQKARKRPSWLPEYLREILTRQIGAQHE